ncbi:MAG: plastocyanin/azurin family copper-binding protein [Thermodesulfobacteriota bacterium]
MRTKTPYPALAFAIALLLAFAGLSNASTIVDDFSKANSRYDEPEMRSIIEENKRKIPGEIDALFDEALKPGTGKEDREAVFYIIERMARVYTDVTGDMKLLKKVKKRTFESRLTPPVRLTPTGGVHVVETLSTDRVKNFFKPDNIIIKKGEAVKWVNNDRDAHLLASILSGIGKGGIISPRIEPGQSWEHRFTKPGDYYYICFIHKVMYGKVTVER